MGGHPYKPYYRPLGRNVLINPIKEESRSKIIAPNKKEANLMKGDVLATGPGTPDWKMSVKRRDIVLFHSRDRIEVEHDNNVIVILDEANIIAKF